MKSLFCAIKGELAFFVNVLFMWGVLLALSLPPVRYDHLEFVQSEARAGEFVTVRATGQWYKQCPSNIVTIWTDEDGDEPVFRETIAGGVAEPSDGVKTNLYGHQIPTQRHDGSALPDRIYLQFVITHHCSRWSPFWTTNKSERIGINIIP